MKFKNLDFFLSMLYTLKLLEGAGGLFDFNATLPLVAIQFILLTVLVTFVLYKPINKTLNSRAFYVSERFVWISRTLRFANAYEIMFKNELESCKTNLKTNAIKAKLKANNAVSSEVKKVRTQSLKLVADSTDEYEIDKLKNRITEELNKQTDELSEYIILTLTKN